MVPSTAVAAGHVFQGLHKVDDQWCIGRVTGNSPGSVIPPPLASVEALGVTYRQHEY